MVIKLPRSRESTPVAVTPPSTTLVIRINYELTTDSPLRSSKTMEEVKTVCRAADSGVAASRQGLAFIACSRRTSFICHYMYIVA